MTEAISAAEYRQQQAQPKRNKYGNTPTVVDGIRFQSKREAAYYAELKLREKAGEVSAIELQRPFPLLGRNGELIATYRADFTYHDLREGRLRVIDVKGVATPVFRLKKKMMQALLGIEVEVIK